MRRPRLDYESHAVALDRNELGALLVAAGLGPPPEHALISLLALNGLRVSEATSADIEQLGLERGHRTLTITRKGGKVVTIPLAPRTARAIDLAIGERADGPVFVVPDGRRLDRHGAGRIVRKVARRAGIGKAVTPHTLRHAFITAALDVGAGSGEPAAVALGTCRRRDGGHGHRGVTLVVPRVRSTLVLKCDNGPGFVARATKEFLRNWSIITLYSPPYAPWYNGAIERANRSLKEETAFLAEKAGHPGYWTSAELHQLAA